MARDLFPLDEATERLRPFARHYVGIRPIDVDWYSRMYLPTVEITRAIQEIARRRRGVRRLLQRSSTGGLVT